MLVSSTSYKSCLCDGQSRHGGLRIGRLTTNKHQKKTCVLKNLDHVLKFVSNFKFNNQHDSETPL